MGDLPLVLPVIVAGAHCELDLLFWVGLAETHSADRNAQDEARVAS